MTDRTIYLVCGAVGEYSDYRAWVVAAYSNRERAEKRRAFCAEAARSIFHQYNTGEVPQNPWDDSFADNFSCFYVAEYAIEETMLHE